MSDLVLAGKDPAVVLSQALAIYKSVTGFALAPTDPRRLHLQAFLVLCAQQRQLIDFSGKQSMVGLVSPTWIDTLAALWGPALAKIPAGPSKTVIRYTPTNPPQVVTVPGGSRSTDGVSVWAVTGGDQSSSGAVDYLDCAAACTVDGSASNGVAIGQIDTMVDQVDGIATVSNTTETISGRDLETTEQQRARLRDAPESTSTTGPRIAYKTLALAASANVADAVALGPFDGSEMAGSAPNAGEIHVKIIKGTRDANGVLQSVVPAPDSGLLTAVYSALSPDTVRPLGDYLFVEEPLFVDFDHHVTYYISRSRSSSAAAIQAAVSAADAAYLLWQQSSIGRDINPSQLDTMLCNAGAKRTVISSPSFTVLQRDQSAQLVYWSLTYGGLEDD